MVKAFAREDFEEKRLDKETQASMEIALRARKVKARLAPTVDIIVAIGTGIVLYYGARQVLAGNLSSGSLVIFLLYLGKMYKPMRDLSKLIEGTSHQLSSDQKKE